MKLVLALVLTLIGLAAYSQNADRASKFHIDSSDLRVKKEGKWCQWTRQYDNPGELDRNFLINLSQKLITWDSKYKDQPRKIFTYPIISEAQDTTYDDLNFWALKLKTKGKNGRISSLVLGINTVNDGTGYIILSTVGDVQERYFVTALN